MNSLSLDHLLESSDSIQTLRCLAWDRHLSRMKSGSKEMPYFKQKSVCSSDSFLDELEDPKEIDHMLSHDLDFLYNEEYNKNGKKAESVQDERNKASRPLLKIDSIPTLIDSDLSSKKAASIIHERSMKIRGLVPQKAFVGHSSKASKINGPSNKYRYKKKMLLSSSYSRENNKFKYRPVGAELIVVMRNKKNNLYDHHSSCSSLSSMEE